MQKISIDLNSMYQLANTQDQALIIGDLKRLMHYRIMYEYYFKLRYKWLRGGKNINIEDLALKMHKYGQEYYDLYKRICNHFSLNSFDLAERYFDSVFVAYETNGALKKKIRGWKRYRSSLSKRPI